MTSRRILAGSVALLLLAVSALAAGCDISCSFAAMNSDCHSRHAAIQYSSSDEMTMSAMDMAGMAMPETARARTPQSVSANRDETSSHPSIGEMGPCEHQACENSSAVSARRALLAAAHFSFVSAFLETPLGTDGSSHLHDARDDVASFPLRDASRLNRNLRI